MGYRPTLWVNHVTPVCADNLNNVESGLTQHATDIEILSEYVNYMDTKVTEDMASLNDYVKNMESEKIAYTTSANSSISSVKDALDILLYTPLVINFTTNKSTTLEKGSIVSNTVFNWTYNKNVISQTFNGEEIDKSLRTYTYSDDITTNKTFILNANDGKSNFSKSITFNFLYPIYVGYLDYNVAIPTETDIKAMTKKIVGVSNQTYNYNIDNKRMCISVPSNWNIRTIIDPNNFDITGSFVLKNIPITCLDNTSVSYKTYISEPTTQSNFTVKFKV